MISSLRKWVKRAALRDSSLASQVSSGLIIHYTGQMGPIPNYLSISHSILNLLINCWKIQSWWSSEL
jgi:hypothetical protein